MNMNMKLSLSPSGLLQKIATFLARYRGFIVAVVVLAMLGYAGFLISRLVSLQPDQAYLADQRQQLDKSKIRFDKATITTINGLNQVNPQVDLSNVGKANPFAP